MGIWGIFDHPLQENHKSDWLEKYNLINLKYSAEFDAGSLKNLTSYKSQNFSVEANGNFGQFQLKKKNPQNL